MKKRYTKGDKNKIVTRIEQVSDITLYIPTTEKCMDYLYDSLMVLCNHYVDENDVFTSIPNIDFYNVALYANKCCKENGVNAEYILAMISVMSSFDNLKHVSVVFKDDVELKDSYERLINIDSDDGASDVINELTNIYSIDCIEMYLGDMFSQDIVDLINMHLISNDIISNSYLEREFLVTFEFDEYISYINMMVENNIDRLSMYDVDIPDYLRVFPAIIGDIAKPTIKLYTNYKEI